jgi:mannan endo-1,4-beta-mannosidase
VKATLCAIGIGLSLVAACAGVAGCGSSGAAPPATGTPSPADPRAGAAARAELDWLADLPARGSGPRLVSGYFGGYGSTFNAYTWSADGKYPALTGCDFADLSGNGQSVIDTSCDAQLRQYAESGGLVTVSVHGPNPSGAAFTTPMSPAQFTQLTQPTTAIGQAWDKQLAQIAAGLARLTDAGVPVLFRPLMEMNGKAFWWDGQAPADYRQVWQHMFTYVNSLLGASGHELLWVWSPGCESVDGVGGVISDGISTTDYFPGGGYADVVGADCYTNEPAGPATARTDDVQRTYQELSGLARQQRKVFAFAELGGDNGNNEAASNVDFSSWISALHDDYPLAAYFLAWDGQVGPASPQNQNGASLLTDPGVIDKGELAGQGW